jgi:5-formyltetrahydrofolate cyclo-ligase
MLKVEIRKIYNEKRQALSAVLINELSEKIANLLKENFELKRKRLGVFLPIEKKKEINLYPLIYQLKESQICIPQSDFETHQMTFNHYVSFDTLSFDKFGIPELKEHKEEHIPELLLIPLLVSDEKGYRVGYGKGFYDRYISEKCKHSIKIGLSFFDPIETISDSDLHDQKLDYLITPTKIYSYV